MRNLGIYDNNTYRDTHSALKVDPVYIKSKNSKPKKPDQLKEWFLRDQEVTVKFVMPNVFP